MGGGLGGKNQAKRIPVNWLNYLIGFATAVAAAADAGSVLCLGKYSTDE